MLQRAEAATFLDSFPSWAHSCDLGIVKFGEVARLQSQVAGLPGGPLAACLGQPLFLSVPVGEGRQGAQ